MRRPALTPAEHRDLAIAWQRREQRVPARFGSHTAFMDAVERGLLTTEPTVSGWLPVGEIMEQLRNSRTETMPEWTPRPKGPNKNMLRNMARGAKQADDEDEFSDYDD